MVYLGGERCMIEMKFGQWLGDSWIYMSTKFIHNGAVIFEI